MKKVKAVVTFTSPLVGNVISGQEFQIRDEHVKPMLDHKLIVVLDDAKAPAKETKAKSKSKSKAKTKVSNNDVDSL